MSYGVYTKDLSGVGFSGGSLEDARKYRYGDRVVCSEKLVKCGFSVEMSFNWKHSFGWHYYRHFQVLDLGWFQLKWHTMSYKWADKIVGDGEAE